MNERCLISVLMPVYNGLPLIKASIESLKRQTLANWECIIVDDGSTDGTSEFLDSIADERFIVHHFEMNQGRPIARQKTLELATGDYIAMLDAEDLYASNALEILFNKMQNYPEVVLVSASMCSFGTKTDVVRKRGAEQEKVVRFDGKHYPNHASSMMRAARAKQFQYNPKMPLGQDRDYLEKYLEGECYVELPIILYYYSEFDSVNKRKIKRTYWLNFRKYQRENNYSQSFSYLLKCLYSLFVFPFLSINYILGKRGNQLTYQELQMYQKECKSIVDNIV